MKFKIAATVNHPKENHLRHTIYTDGYNYYFDYNGDWYNVGWCNDPLKECKKDAMEDLNEDFNNHFSIDAYFDEIIINENGVCIKLPEKYENNKS